MGRASIKENKNVYQLKREELGLSREKASELLECVPPERIEKIDSEKVLPHPDEVLIISINHRNCVIIIAQISVQLDSNMFQRLF